MPEYVTKEAIKQAMRSQPRGILFTEWELDRVPTVDAVEVVHGQVEKLEQPQKIWADSRCKHCQQIMLSTDNYCPNCGAKMDGGINK